MRKITANSIGLEAGAAGALLTGREKRDNVFEAMPLELSRRGAVSEPAQRDAASAFHDCGLITKPAKRDAGSWRIQ